MDKISEELVAAGYSYSGKDFLHSGINGALRSGLRSGAAPCCRGREGRAGAHAPSPPGRAVCLLTCAALPINLTPSALPSALLPAPAPTTTGEALEAYIFMGPVYYQKLKHMVRPGVGDSNGDGVGWGGYE